MTTDIAEISVYTDGPIAPEGIILWCGPESWRHPPPHTVSADSSYDPDVPFRLAAIDVRGAGCVVEVTRADGSPVPGSMDTQSARWLCASRAEFAAGETFHIRLTPERSARAGWHPIDLPYVSVTLYGDLISSPASQTVAPA